MPDSFSVKKWLSDVPENFRFAVKFPRVITHNKRLIDIERPLSRFYSAMFPLAPKNLTFLIQLPPSFGAKDEEEARITTSAPKEKDIDFRT